MSLVSEWTFVDHLDKSGNGHDLTSNKQIMHPMVFDGSTYCDVPTLSEVMTSATYVFDISLDDAYKSSMCILSINTTHTDDNVFLIGTWGGLHTRVTTQTTTVPYGSVSSGERFILIITTEKLTASSTRVNTYVNKVLLRSEVLNSTVDYPVYPIKPFGLGFEWDSNVRGDYLLGKMWRVSIHDHIFSQEEILATEFYDYEPNADIKVCALTKPLWSNRETKAQANPQPEQLATLDANAPIATTVVKNNPFYNDVVLDQQGNQRKFGFIASTTQVSGIPVANKRVLLFTDDTALLIDETVSDAQGNYRFDSLLLNKKYMITAQYGNADENTQPDYSATSVDWQSPTPYIEEV